MAAPAMTIGELAKRLDVSVDVLRAWERRYGVLQPERSTGGYRLYSPADEERARRVIELRRLGVTTAIAARQAMTRSPLPEPKVEVYVRSACTDLVDAVRRFDAVAFRRALDAALATIDLETIVGSVVLPVLRDIGERWERGELDIAHEHFASHEFRRRIGSLAAPGGDGSGHIAVLACPPRERHDIALLCFGVLLSRAGWSVRFLGGDIPLAEVARVAAAVRPDLVVLAATRRSRFLAQRAQLSGLAGRFPIAIAGCGASSALAAAVGGRLLPNDVVEAVRSLTGSVAPVPAM